MSHDLQTYRTRIQETFTGMDVPACDFTLELLKHAGSEGLSDAVR